MWILSPEFGHTPKKNRIFFLKAVLGVFWSAESIFEVHSCSKKFFWPGKNLPCLSVRNCSAAMAQIGLDWIGFLPLINSEQLQSLINTAGLLWLQLSHLIIMYYIL